MIFKQFRHEPLNQASYLLACWRKGLAFVVDPIADRGVASYQAEAETFASTACSILDSGNPAPGAAGHLTRRLLRVLRFRENRQS